MKLETLHLTTYQAMILAQRGYTQASSVKFTAGNSGVGGVDVVALRNGKWSLIDEDTWTQVVNAMLTPPVAAAPKAVTSPAPAQPKPAARTAAKPVQPKQPPVFEPPVETPPTPPRVEASRVRPPADTPFIKRMKEMLQPKKYGTDAELVGAANAYAAEIRVYQDLPKVGRKEVATFKPEAKRAKRRIAVLYTGRIHYNSLVNGNVVVEDNDGNCMFHALARALKSDHATVRQRVCNWMIKHKEMKVAKYGDMTLANVAMEATRNH